GEALTAHQIGLFKEKFPNVALYNLYGPTEAAIDVTCWKVPDEFDEVSIGSAISNTSLYVLDENLNPLPKGETGELFIGGIQVARGYLNRPELTEKCFIQHPFENSGDRLYRTGDLAKVNENNEIIYLGRIDNQVKIRGQRIELGEIEHAITRTKQVKQCCVHVYEDSIVGKQIIGYLVGEETSIDIESLNSELKKSLPEYMVPSRYILIESLPLNNNGKLDRKALPKPVRRRPDSDFFKPAKTPSEKILVKLWAELLGVERVGILDNFFGLGGNSLLAMKMVAILSERYSQVEPVIKLYQFPTI